MRVLFVGLGSAGQRHLRNLKMLLDDKLEVLAYRVRRYSRTFNNELQVIPGKDVNTEYNIKVFYDLEEALLEEPEFAVIANPNSMHVETAKIIAQHGIDLFIEKPLGITMNGVEELQKIIYDNNLCAFVGFQMHYHPCIKKIKKMIYNHELGKILHVDVDMGELLSRMHSYEDYRGMCESKNAMGGGVVLSQIHEIDYIYHIFGLPECVFSVGGKSSDLEIDVEDHATTLCKYRWQGEEFPIVIHQDFLQYPATRKCKIVGTLGRIELNLLDGTLDVIMSDTEHLLCEFKEFQRNDMFLEEMKQFLKAREGDKKADISIEDAKGSLQLALAIKESMSKSEMIYL